MEEWEATFLEIDEEKRTEEGDGGDKTLFLDLESLELFIFVLKKELV